MSTSLQAPATMDPQTCQKAQRGRSYVNCLDETIRRGRETMRLSVTKLPLHPSQLDTILSMSDALRDRYIQLGRIEDLAEQITLLHPLMYHVGNDTTHIVPLRCNLGTALRERHLGSRNAEDINQAVEIHTHLLEECPPGTAHRPQILCELARTLVVLRQLLRRGETFEYAITLANEALAILPQSSPWSLRAHVAVVCALVARGIQETGLSDLHAACKLGEEIVVNLPEDQAECFVVHHFLSHVNQTLYYKNSEPVHLDNALEHRKRAIDLLDSRSQRRVQFTCLMASILHSQLNKDGDLSNLDKSIAALQKIEHIPLRYSDYYYTVLGNILLDRADFLGWAEDLDQGVLLLRKRLAISPDSSTIRTYALQSLGDALRKRYDWEKKLDDLEESIELCQECLNLCSSLNISTNFINVFQLVEALSKYYEETGSRSKLMLASELCKKWLLVKENTPIGYIQHNFLLQCGKVFMHLNALDQGSHYLDTAISYFEEALQITSQDHTGKGDVLIELAAALTLRLTKLCADADGSKAKLHLEDALKLLPLGRAHRASALFKLAELHLSRLENHEALLRLTEALADDHQNAQMRLTSAIKILALIDAQMDERKELSSVRNMLLSAYRQAVELLPRVAYFGLDMASRLQALTRSDKLAADGAAHALNLQRPGVAIEMLEQGRAVFW